MFIFDHFEVQAEKGESFSNGRNFIAPFIGFFLRSSHTNQIYYFIHFVTPSRHTKSRSALATLSSSSSGRVSGSTKNRVVL